MGRLPSSQLVARAVELCRQPPGDLPYLLGREIELGLQRPFRIRETIRRLHELLRTDGFASEPVIDLPLDLPEASAAELAVLQRKLRLASTPGHPRMTWRFGWLFLVAYYIFKRRRTSLKTILQARCPRDGQIPFGVVPDELIVRPSVHPEPVQIHENFQVVAPLWLMELLRPEGVSCARRAGLLVAWDGVGAPPTSSLANPDRPGSAVWLLDGALPPPEWAELLRPDDRVFVSDPSLHEVAQHVFGRDSELLEPAVQPLLHRPFGRWQDRADATTGVECGPPRWRERQRAAMGYVQAAKADVPLPSWSTPDWERDARRFWECRRTLREHSVGQRLDRLARAFGLPQRCPELPWVTAVMSTNRPAQLESALDSYAKQRYSRRDLVLVLHGDGFDRAVVDKALGQRGIEATVLPMSSRWTLGHCLTAGCRSARGDYVAVIDDDNWFGERYFEDSVLWMTTSGALVGGKYSMPVFFEDDRSLHLIFPTCELGWGEPSSAQAMFRRDLVEALPWRGLLGADTSFFRDCRQMGIRMVQFDRYNFGYCRGARQHSSHYIERLGVLDDLAIRLARVGSPGDCDL